MTQVLDLATLSQQQNTLESKKKKFKPPHFFFLNSHKYKELED